MIGAHQATYDTDRAPEFLNQDVLLIDANSVGYAAMYQPALSSLTFDGRKTNALHGFFASFAKLTRLFPNAVPILLWDGQAQWRKDLYPNYKAERTADPEKLEIRKDYKRQAQIIESVFTCLGVPKIKHEDAEADDLAGLIARNIDARLRVVMATRDTDYLQSISPHVAMFNARNDEFITPEVMAKETFKDGPFFSGHHYISAKAMAGDESDGIEGVSGIGIKTAAKILRDYGSFEALWELVDAGSTIKGAKLNAVTTPDARTIYERNKKLMDWSLAPIPDDVDIEQGLTDWEQAFLLMKNEGLDKMINHFSQALKQQNTLYRQERDREVVSMVCDALTLRGYDYGIADLYANACVESDADNRSDRSRMLG